jgi:hypothetical protein
MEKVRLATSLDTSGRAARARATAASPFTTRTVFTMWNDR